MNLTIKIFFTAVILVIQTVFPQESNYSNEGLVYLKSNLEFLASDLLEGRETGTRGIRLASSFIVSELKKYGIKPFGDDGSYFQNFNLLSIKYDEKSKITLTGEDGQSEELSIGDDYLISKVRLPSIGYCNEKMEIVFARYGIIAGDYNDYKNLNVKGKIVLLLQGIPKLNENNISSEATEYLISEEYKVETAKNLGAAGIFFIPEELTIQYWKTFKSKTLAEDVEIVKGEIENLNIDSSYIPVIGLSEDASIKLLENEKYDYSLLKLAVERNNKPESFNLNKKVLLDYRYDVKILQARNVIGLIEGTDENLKEQYLTFRAHYVYGEKFITAQMTTDRALLQFWKQPEG
jgi:hypothetical protein